MPPRKKATVAVPAKAAKAPRKPSGPSVAALAKFEADFAKSHGEGTIRRTNTPTVYDVLPTGSITLDYALGVGGLVEGRIIEMWGPEGAGKTTLACLMMAESQRKHPQKMVAVVDVEQTWDSPLAEKLGVDNDRVFLVQPPNAESVADIVKDLVASPIVALTLLDSIGAMIPEEEIEKNAGDATVGTTAKIITRMVKIAAVRARQTGNTLVVINQVRASIGNFRGATTTTGGGWALKHVTSMKLKVSRTDTYTVGKDEEMVVVGQTMSVKVEKNKVASPGRIAKLSIFNSPSDKYGPAGVDRAFEAWVIGKRLNLLGAQPGGYYTMPNGERLRSEPVVIEYLRNNPDQVEVIRERILATTRGEIVDDGPVGAPVDDDASEDAATGTFFEEDEPVIEVVKAFENGEQGVTEDPEAQA